MDGAKSGNLFLHFMDSYRSKYAHQVMRYPWQLITDELLTAFRLAYLVAPRLFVSASAFMENRATRQIIQSHSLLGARGELWIVGAEGTLDEHNEIKRAIHYVRSPETEVQRAYTQLIRPLVPYKRAPVEVASAVEAAWLGGIEHGLESQFSVPGDWNARERAWIRVPEVLGDSALVAPHIAAALLNLGSDIPEHSNILKLVDQGYATSHADVLDASVIGDLVYLRLAEDDLLADRIGLSYLEAVTRLPVGLRTEVLAATPTSLVDLKGRLDWRSLIVADQVIPGGYVRRPGSSVYAGRGEGETVTIAIVVALPIEWVAIKEVFGAQTIHATDSTDPNLEYATAKLRGLRHSIDLVLLFIAEPGQNAATAHVSNLVRSRADIQQIIVGGIAGACPTPGDTSRDIRLGDVLVSSGRGIIQVDFGAVRDGVPENRSTVPPPSALLLRNAAFLYADRETVGDRAWAVGLASFADRHAWAKRPAAHSDRLLDNDGMAIRRTRRDEPKAPRVFHGIFGSSNSLVRDPVLRDKWRDTFGILAVEMEGAGASEAAWKSGHPYLMVRSMVDYCDNRTKNDAWHGYASVVSALYIRTILERLAGGTT